LTALSYAGEHGFVFASINYRLGVLGYLAHPHLTQVDPLAPTNFGLLDQRFALEWVQRNIKYFGGDANQVTISGESAGGCSVWAHLADGKASERKLFKRAIVMSIAPQITAIPLKQAEEAGRWRANRLGCSRSSNDPESLAAEIDCMRQIPHEDVHDPSARELFVHSLSRIPSRVIANDGVNFDFSVESSGRSTGYADVDVLMGSIRDEGGLFTFLTFPAVSASPDFYQRLVRNAFDPLNIPGLSDDILATYAVASYENKRNHSTAAMQALSEVMGDFFINCPTTHLMTELQNYRKRSNSSTGRVFGYAWAPLAYSAPLFKSMGVTHGSELPLFFGLKNGAFFSRSYTEAEASLGKQLRDSVAQFVRSGNPTTPEMPWIPFDLEQKKVLVIESETKKYYENFKGDKCAFWKSKFPEHVAPQILVADPMAGEELISSWANHFVVALLRTLVLHRRESLAGLVALLVVIVLAIRRCCSTKSQSKTQGKQIKTD
jgi:carboxylesterase type B